MKKQTIFIIFLSIVFFIALNNHSFAGDLFSNGADLGKWWLQNSKTISPTPDPILYHIEGKYAFNKLTGNADVNVQNVNFSLTLRKKIITSLTMYGENKNEMTISVGKVKTLVKRYDFGEIMTLDITPFISLEGGFLWEENSQKYIMDRYTYFTGFKFQKTFIKRLNLRMGAYFGRDETEYDNEEIIKLLPTGVPVQFTKIPKYNSNGARLIQHLSFPITKTIFFQQNFDFMQYFENSDYYHWTVDCLVNFVIVKGVSFFVKYKIDYENNIYVETGRAYFDKLNNILRSYNMDDIGTLHKDNDLLAIGIQISL